MLKHITCAALLCLTTLSVLANTPVNTWEFIDLKSTIAIHEMDRKGIPASITLAQSIVESSWGTGTLAREANNYFGIKCKSNWTGETFYLKDDDFENGELIESCFRVYESMEMSFVDHSDFLKDNQKRYGFLFKLPKTDYKAWARGLLEAGYATDEQYAEKLIANIEKYELYRYDHQDADFNVETGMEIPTIEDTSGVSELAENLVVPEAFELPEDYTPNYYGHQPAVVNLAEELLERQTQTLEVDPTAHLAAVSREEPMPARSTEANSAMAPIRPTVQSAPGYNLSGLTKESVNEATISNLPPTEATTVPLESELKLAAHVPTTPVPVEKAELMITTEHQKGTMIQLGRKPRLSNRKLR